MGTPKPHNEQNSLAVASLVLGILSLTGASVLTGIPAIITGIMSFKNPVNKNMGIAGIVMGSISVVFAVLVALFIILIIVGAFVFSTESIPLPDDSGPSQPNIERRI